MSYGDLIKRPFEIVARRPYLWLLGFLAGGATTFNYTGGGGSYSRPATSGTYQGPTWTTIQAVWNDNLAWILGILAAIAVVCLVLFALGCIATGGIIRAAVELDEGREYSLGTAWRAGSATGWRIAGLRILTFLLSAVPGLLVGSLVLAAIVGAPNSAGMAVGFGLIAAVAFLAAVVFWVVLGVAFELAQRLIVLEGGHVAESLSAGFRMVASHLKQLALGWIILIALGIAAGIVMAILVVVVAIPAFAIGWAGWAAAGSTGVIIGGTFAAVLFLGVILAAGGAYAAYSSVYWTLLFKKVRALPAPAARGAIVPA